MGHKSHSPQLWEVLGIFPKTHYEEYHKNPEVAGHIRGNLGSKMGLLRKRANNKFCELEFKNQ